LQACFKLTLLARACSPILVIETAVSIRSATYPEICGGPLANHYGRYYRMILAELSVHDRSIYDAQFHKSSTEPHGNPFACVT
jgi:hypothetical protein